MCLFVLLYAITLSDSRILLTQIRSDKPQPSDSQIAAKTASVKVVVSAEGKTAIPSGSKIQWEGTSESCTNVTGEQTLRPTETPLRLPVCKVRLTIFITGFNTQAVVVDLVGNEKKYADPIHITAKLQGSAEISWTHSEKENPK